jgi:hypothetical protein
MPIEGRYEDEGFVSWRFTRDLKKVLASHGFIGSAMILFHTALLIFMKLERPVANLPQRYWHKKARHSLC